MKQLFFNFVHISRTATTHDLHFLIQNFVNIVFLSYQDLSRFVKAAVCVHIRIGISVENFKFIPFPYANKIYLLLAS